MSSISQAHEQVQKVKEFKKKGPKSRRLPADSLCCLKMSNTQILSWRSEQTHQLLPLYVQRIVSWGRVREKLALNCLASVWVTHFLTACMTWTVFHFPRLHTLTGPSVCKRHSVFKWCLAPQTVSFYKASQVLVSQWLYQRLPHDINNADLALSV